MRSLLKYLKGYKVESVIAPLFKMLEASFELIVPLITARIIDIGIADRDKSFILHQCIILVLLGVVGLICSLTAQYFAAKSSMGMGANIRKAMYHHVNTFSYEELDLIKPSTLINRITGDVNQVQNGVNLFLRLFMRAPFIVIGAIFMASTISLRLTGIFLLAMILIGTSIFLIVKITVKLYTKVQEHFDAIVLHTRESYSGARVIRAFHKERKEQEAFKEEGELLNRFQIQSGRISALLNPLTTSITNIGIISLLILGGKEVYRGTLSQGEVVALINYMSQILLALLILVNLVVSITKALASGKRVAEVLALQPRMQEGKETTGLGKAEGISFKGVSFSYPNSDETAIENVEFSIPRGETIGIIGGTGAGKTTLINLIPRLYDATKGEVLLDGRKVQEYTYKRLRARVSIVPQRSVLFSGTIRENMQWRKESASDEEIWEALEIAQAKEFVMEKQEGLDGIVQGGGRNFSGGQRQRLCIARALIGKPDILILDDSASALDYATDAALRKALRRVGKELTTIIVSQRVASIKHGDVIFVMDEGRIQDIGNHEELRRTSEIYQELCRTQLGKGEAL